MPANAYAGKTCVCQKNLEGQELCDQSCVADMLATKFYVACLKLTGRRCLVVGGGAVALEKIENLLVCEATVRVVAPTLCGELAELAGTGDIEHVARDYDGPSDLDGCLMAIAATDDTAVNLRVYDDAEARAMLVNVVDVPPMCNFILPAIVRSGPIAIAISTSGASPALAKRMKREIAEHFGNEYAELAVLLNEVRGWAKATLPTYHDRKAFFEDIVAATPDPIKLMREGNRGAVLDLIAAKQREHVGALQTAR